MNAQELERLTSYIRKTLAGSSRLGPWKALATALSTASHRLRAHTRDRGVAQEGCTLGIEGSHTVVGPGPQQRGSNGAHMQAAQKQRGARAGLGVPPKLRARKTHLIKASAISGMDTRAYMMVKSRPAGVTGANVP